MSRTAARHDPALNFRFEVQLDDLPVGGFSECTGLQLETEAHTYAEGGLNTHLRTFPSRTKQTRVTLKRGIVDRVLWDWYWEILDQGVVRRRKCSVVIKDASGDSVVGEWQFRDAFPCKWIGPDLNATQNAVAVETFELCHQGLERRS